MKKYKTIQVSPWARRVLQLLARQCDVDGREMYLTELIDFIATKASHIEKLLDK